MSAACSRSGALLEAALPSSRYEADFTELRQLGRGGYGVVVAAINRLDGRQYAVKKIPLEAHSAGAYARIMREVTTLSRLQHTNVVRYFQAWVEARMGQAGGDSDEVGSELDEWGSDSLMPPSGGGGVKDGAGGGGAPQGRPPPRWGRQGPPSCGGRERGGPGWHSLD